MRSVEQYINDVCKGLNLSADTRATIREELAAHIEDAAAASIESGNSHEAAIDAAVRTLGDAAELRAHYGNTYRNEHATRTIGRMLGLGAFAAILIATCSLGSSAPIFDTFWCPEAAFLVFFGPLCLSLASNRMRVAIAALISPFRMSINDRDIDYVTAAAVLRHWAFATIGCGAWAAVFGIITTCLRSGELAAIGPAVAFTILGLLYSLILAGILWTLAGSLPQADDAAVCPGQPSIARRVIAICAFFGIVATTSHMLAITSTEISGFVDTLSVLFVVAGSGSLLIATLGVSDALALFSPDSPAQRRAESLRDIGRYGLIVGVIGTLLGFVIVLATLNDLSRLTMSVAVALLTMLYGQTCWLLCLGLAGPRASHTKTDRPIELGAFRPA